MNQNLISIIIPAYNAEKYIETCLNSILLQTYPNIEVLVINDGSTDCTEELIKKFSLKDSRVHCISQRNLGASAARNLGLKYANGEFIMFLDSDDWLEKECCEISLNTIKQYQADVLMFDYYKIINNKRYPYNSYSKKIIEFNTDKENSTSVYDMRAISVWGKLYKLNSIKDIYFDESIKISEDVDFNFRVYNHVEKIIYIQKYMLNYRVLNSSAVHGYDKNIFENIMQPIKKMETYMLEDNQVNAYYSFVAIAYMVICQNGIYLSPEVSLKDKYMEIRKLSKDQTFKNLFLNAEKLVLPLSRKLFIFLGKYHFYYVIILILSLKKRFKNL